MLFIYVMAKLQCHMILQKSF